MSFTLGKAGGGKRKAPGAVERTRTGGQDQGLDLGDSALDELVAHEDHCKAQGSSAKGGCRGAGIGDTSRDAGDVDGCICNGAKADDRSGTQEGEFVFHSVDVGTPVPCGLDAVDCTLDDAIQRHQGPGNETRGAPQSESGHVHLFCFSSPPGRKDFADTPQAGNLFLPEQGEEVRRATPQLCFV